MTRRNFFQLAAALLLVASAAGGRAEVMDLTVLRTTVEQHLAQHYTARGAVHVDDIEIEVSELDPRLRLRSCPQPLTVSVKEPPQGHGNLTVKTSCDAGQQWTIYVPARVDIYASVAVAARTLDRGHRMTESDVSSARSNVSRLGHGHIADPARVVGLELQRPMRAGEAFRLANLDQPEVVKRGDSVVVEAQAGGLIVVAPGKALADGRVGQQIRVENTQSERTVRARVVGPGRVRVVL